MTFAEQLQAAKGDLTARQVASAVSPLLPVITQGPERERSAMTPTETPELKPKRNGVIRCTALLGRFPVGVPVLIHDQLNGDGLETHIGIITKCEDALCLAETYYGKISAIIVTGTLQTNSVTSLEHYSKRISACYWLHLSEADLMIEDCARSWNADEVRERVEYLMASVRPNVPDQAQNGRA